VSAVRESERGSSLVEILVVLSLMLALLAGTYALSNAPASVASSALALPRLFDEARVLAATSGDGATIVLTPSAGPAVRGFDVALYRYRPRSNGAYSAGGITLEKTEHLAGALSTSATGSAPVAIFLSTSGTASYAAWSPIVGSISQEPACTAPLNLMITAGNAVARFQLACDEARLART
jgi:hypothetical protein